MIAFLFCRPPPPLIGCINIPDTPLYNPFQQEKYKEVQKAEDPSRSVVRRQSTTTNLFESPSIRCDSQSPGVLVFISSRYDKTKKPYNIHKLRRLEKASNLFEDYPANSKVKRSHSRSNGAKLVDSPRH